MEPGEGGNAEMCITGLVSSSLPFWNVAKGDTSSVEEEGSVNTFCFELFLESEPNGNLAIKPPLLALMLMLPLLTERAGVVGAMDEVPKENLLRNERIPGSKDPELELKFKLEWDPTAIPARPPWLAFRILSPSEVDGLLGVAISSADWFELEPITGNDGELERPKPVRIPEKERRCLGGCALAASALGIVT